ncbi:MAG: hypothetical protein OK439_03070, partial [Thaumarchaeota archaeon]|nr:hypothetical protein [Nitrososphaerota archaeon]
MDRKPARSFLAAALILLLTLVSPIPSPSHLGQHSTHPAKMSTPRQLASHAHLPAKTGNSPSLSSSNSSLPVPNYDEQLGLTFTESFSRLSYNVTAVEQQDSYGYGPAYLLNGLTNLGNWYQVGLSWDWPFLGGGFAPGFGFNFEAFS